jgi:hypothetical protein
MQIVFYMGQLRTPTLLLRVLFNWELDESYSCLETRWYE